MKQVGLLLLLFVWFLSPCSAAEERYTLVLGLSAPGESLLGYQEYARFRCPTELPCKTYFDLYDSRTCSGFYDCVSRMMAGATYIVFLVDKPGGLMSMGDTKCNVSDPAEPMDGEYTPLELCIVTNCDLLFSKTCWWSQQHESAVETFACSSNEHCLQ